MRYLSLIIALVCMLWAYQCPAQDKPACAGETCVDRDGDGVSDGVDVYGDSGRIIRRGYDTNGDGVMERWQSYDQNTGLPNVVGSDTAGELP